ncbi:MAG: hypothetical protein V9G04_01890 [Nocardioides sp.]|jgi:Mce-associated membrane protein
MALLAALDRRNRSLITRPLIAAALALVVALGVLAWVASTRLGGDDDVQRQREAAMSQARQFMLRIGTYGPDKLDAQGRMPAYAEQVREVITPKFAAEFDKEGGRLAEQLVAQGGVSRDAEVFATGISDLDADSAVALVSGTFTDSYPDGKSRLVAQEPVPVRLSVQLVKVDGDWLVDDFGPAGGAR